VIYPGVPFDITAILHPIHMGASVGEETVKCSDLIVEYEIFAEDMVPVSSSLHITERQITEGLFPLGTDLFKFEGAVCSLVLSGFFALDIFQCKRNWE
jgi:hypothetical protein